MAPDLNISLSRQTILANKGNDGLNRTMLTFFAGGVHNEDMKYSGGARQALYGVLHGSTHEDVLVAEGRIGRSVLGYSWGVRLSTN